MGCDHYFARNAYAAHGRVIADYYNRGGFIDTEKSRWYAAPVVLIKL